MDRRLHIGLDFDDTLMDTREAIVDLLNAVHGTTRKHTEITEYYLSPLWNLTDEGFTEFFNKYETTIHLQPAMPGMLPVIEEWQTRSDFSVITGRPLAWLPSAKRWMEDNGMQIKELASSAKDAGKGVAARRMQIDFFVEDHARSAKEVADAGIPVFMFDRVYNQGFSHELVTRVAGWEELNERVSKRWPLVGGTI